MAEQLAGLECPVCKNGVHLKSSPSGVYCTTNPTHRWNDTASLLSMNPKRLPVPGQNREKIQDGYESISLSIPSKLRAMLQERFKERLSSTIAGVLYALAEPGSFVVGKDDAERIEKTIGKTVKDGNSLFGEVYALQSELTTVKANYEAVMQSRGEQSTPGGAGRVVINIQPIFEQVAARAKFRETNIEKLCEEIIGMGVQNGWM